MYISIRDDTARTSLRGVCFIDSSNNNRLNSTGIRRTPAATMSVLLRLGMDFAVFASMSDATSFYLDFVAPTPGPTPAPAPTARRTRRDIETRDEAIAQAFSALPDGTDVLLTPRDQLVIDTIDHQRGLIAQRTAKRIAELLESSSSTPSTPPISVPDDTQTIFE